MLRNQFIGALRFFRKHKTFALLNFSGLTIGFISSLAIAAYASFQLSFDHFHKNADAIYRVESGEGDVAPKLFPSLSLALQNNVTGIIAAARLKMATGAISTELMLPGEEKIYWADDSFLSMFSFPLKSGPVHALRKPFSAVVTERLALRYFKNHNVVGKTLTFIDSDNIEQQFEITAVLMDIPANSHLTFDVLLSYSSLEESDSAYPYGWSWRGVYTYVLLSPGTRPAEIEHKSVALLKQYKTSPHNSISENDKLKLVPLTRIHNYSRLQNDAEVYGNIHIIYFLIALAVLLFIVSLFNYINLTTVSSAFRFKEIGVKKIIGARNKQIIGQFIMESAIIFISSFILAFLILYIVYPRLNQVVPVQTPGALLTNIRVITAITMIVLTGIILSGVYTFFLLNSIQPGALVKGSGGLLKGKRTTGLLMVCQFTICMALMVFTFSIYSQIRYMMNKNLGISINELLIVKPAKHADNKKSLWPAFKNRLTGYDFIQSVTASDQVPGRKITTAWWGVECIDKHYRPDEETALAVLGTDKDFMPTYQLQFLAGRNFQDADHEKVILNHCAANMLGFPKPEAAIHQVIIIAETRYEVVGVTENYHHMSLKENYLPVIITTAIASNPYYSIRITSADKHKAIENIKVVWKEIYPDDVFDYFFLGDAFAMQYQDDVRFGKTFGILSGLIFLIACFGLTGVAVFVTEKRSKEVAIRRVLGSNAFSIMKLFYAAYFKQIIIASVIALPSCYYLIQQWISRYPFRMDFSIQLYAFPLVMLMVITFFTVGSVVARILRSKNTIQAIRTE